MSLRKRHEHPKLTIPSSVKRITYHGHRVGWLRQKISESDNDHGRVIAGRVFAYHPTKGWRSRAA